MRQRARRPPAKAHALLVPTRFLCFLFLRHNSPCLLVYNPNVSEQLHTARQDLAMRPVSAPPRASPCQGPSGAYELFRGRYAAALRPQRLHRPLRPHLIIGNSLQRSRGRVDLIIVFCPRRKHNCTGAAANFG